MGTVEYKVPFMADLAAEGRMPEVLFWVGCAGSFDQRAQKVTLAFCEILNSIGVEFAVLGKEESCTGDPARRAGNEFVFQMLAQQNVAMLNMYNVKKIVTTCPHCYNILKNEYPTLGGNYEVMHHSEFLESLIKDGRLVVQDDEFKNKKITYHDPCYLGRGNRKYEAPRTVINSLDGQLVEMKANKENALCCGAGGAQMWKEEEKGDIRINEKRTGQALEVRPDYIAVACPYCNTMLTDGVKGKEKQDEVQVMDLAEMVAMANNL